MRASRWLRRVEITLWILGISLLGVALGATLDRWHYQAQQERVLFSNAGADARADRFDRASRTESEDLSVAADTKQYAVAMGPEPAAAEEVDGSADHYTAEAVELVSVVPRRLDEKRSEAAADPAAFGRIEIPRLGLAAIVREGADEATLARAVGLVPGTARPGEPGNIVLAGHRDTFFRPLRRIEVNDRIRLVVPPHTYEYRVESLRVVAPDETSVLDSNGVEELTLVTCYPFRLIGSAPDRFIVSATRVD